MPEIVPIKPEAAPAIIARRFVGLRERPRVLSKTASKTSKTKIKSNTV